MGAYPIGIVGESFENDDGTSRQAEIKRCTAGEPVTLVRDPKNKYDSKCVKVVSTRGIQIGNISRDDDWICERLDREGFVDARVLRVGAGAKGKLGVVLCIRTSDDDEWIEDESHSAAHAGCSTALLIASVATIAVVIDAVAR